MFRFAAPIEVSYTLDGSGTWEILDDGSRLWRLRIASPGALHLNLGIQRFEMPAVKVLDGCAINQRHWVFAAATTDVAYTLRVRDTASGGRKTYTNRQGVAAPATTDTSAFATCP